MRDIGSRADRNGQPGCFFLCLFNICSSLYIQQLTKAYADAHLYTVMCLQARCGRYTSRKLLRVTFLRAPGLSVSHAICASLRHIVRKGNTFLSEFI